MRVDVQTLGTFNQLAHEGARQAVRSLEQLTGVEPTVEATTIDLATERDVVADFRERDFVGVAIEFTNAIEGQALLVFERASARKLVEQLPGGDPDAAGSFRSCVEEVGNILVSGFVDGWADHLDATIDISPPAFVQGSGADALPPEISVRDDSEHLLSFTSRLEVTSVSIDASVYLVPERDSLRSVFEDQLADDPARVSLPKLEVFKHMTRRGTEEASDNVTAMTGVETCVQVSQLSFLPVEQTVAKLDDDPYVGIVVALEGLLSGFLLVLFDESSAGAIAEQLGASPVEDEFTDTHRSAIEEIGNIMCSGFIDGWANVLQTSINHTPPEFVHDYATAVVDPVANRLATQQRYVFAFDSVVETTDRSVTCELLALPNEAELTDALARLDVGVETAADGAALDEAMNAQPEDVF